MTAYGNMGGFLYSTQKLRICYDTYEVIRKSLKLCVA